MQIHPVFHVALLRPYQGTPPNAPAPIVIDAEYEYEIDHIVAHRGTERRR